MYHLKRAGIRLIWYRLIFKADVSNIVSEVKI